jgi:hypothetical protein
VSQGREDPPLAATNRLGDRRAFLGSLYLRSAALFQGRKSPTDVIAVTHADKKRSIHRFAIAIAFWIELL